MKEYEPMDFYDEYSEWLMNQPELFIGNGKMLTNYFEKAWGFDEFLASKGLSNDD